MHDLVFHVIFGCNTLAVLEMVQASGARLQTIVQCPFLEGMLARLARRDENVNADTAKALFFLLLNVDMVLKTYVCNPRCAKAFSAAMNISHNNKRDQQQRDCAKLHAWSMMGTREMDPAKARRFFSVLHDSIVKTWLQDERLQAGDLVQMVKEEYLVA